MEEELNIAEVRKVLEDANLYEPNMTNDQMVVYYKAINNSMTTATEEDESRRLNETQEEFLEVLDKKEEADSIVPKNKEKPFIPKTWTSEQKILNADIPERNNNENQKADIAEDTVKDLPKDATKETFGFNEMAKDSQQTLNIISHKLKFMPVHNSQTFLNSGTARKAKMLYAYHTKVNKMKTQLARMSFYPAPVPKVTSITDTFPNISDDVDFQETYISRSGRQTKRKVYNYDEDDDSLDGVIHKKTKNCDEQEWLKKATQNKTYGRLKKPETNHVSTKADRPELESTETKNETTKPPPKIENKPPLLKKLSNEEIMKRSSLFTDSKRNYLGVDTPKRRCEIMFDKLKDEEEKKEKEEKTMEAFNKTLDRLDDTNNENAPDDDVITVDDDEPRRTRVVPPVPGRRAINNRKRGLAPLNITVNSPTPKKDSVTKQGSSSGSSQDANDISPKPIIRKRFNQRKSSTSDSGVETLPSTSRLSKTTTTSNVPCPICGEFFHENKIQEHASTCGDEPVTRSSPKLSRLTCEACDRVIGFNTSYEDHIKECSAKNNGNL